MATTKLMTAEDLFLMGEDEGRLELIEGELRDMPPTGEEHGEISALLTSFLVIHTRQHHLGTVYAAETGFYLARNPDVVLAPDVAFVSAGRLPEDRDRRKYVDIAPDLVVEVVSPSESAGDVSNKVQRYLNAGDELDGGTVLPEFKLPLSDLFE